MTTKTRENVLLAWATVMTLGAGAATGLAWDARTRVERLAESQERLRAASGAVASEQSEGWARERLLIGTVDQLTTDVSALTDALYRHSDRLNAHDRSLTDLQATTRVLVRR